MTDVNVLDFNVVSEVTSSGTGLAGAIQNSNVGSASVNVVIAYIELIFNILVAGGVTGLISFLIVLMVTYFVLSQLVPLKIPKWLNGLLAGIITILTAQFTVVFVYNWLVGFLGGAII